MSYVCRKSVPAAARYRNGVPAYKAGAKVGGRREGLEGFLKFVVNNGLHGKVFQPTNSFVGIARKSHTSPTDLSVFNKAGLKNRSIGSKKKPINRFKKTMLLLVAP